MHFYIKPEICKQEIHLDSNDRLLNNSPETINPNQKLNRSLVLIFLIMMMDVVGISLLSPVAPQIVLEFSDKAVMVTMVTVLYAVGQFLATPIIGKLGDRFGRRPVLLLSVAGQAIGYFIFGLGGSLWVLFLGRLIGGITAGNLSTASAYIADVSPINERSKNFALIGSAWSLGLIIGPALGGAFGQINLQMPAFVASFFAVINVILSIFLLPESLPKERRDTKPLTLRDYNPIISIFDMARKPGLGIILLVNAFFSFAFDAVSATSALFVIEKFNAVTWQISLLLILGGVSIAVSSTFFVSKYVPKLGEKKALVGGLFGLSSSFLGIFFVPFLWLVYPVQMIASAMNAFIFPSMTTLSADYVSYRELGVLMGVSSAVSSLMNVFGPLWGGIIYDALGVGAPYWTGAILLVFTGWLMSRVHPLHHYQHVDEINMIP